ncbi:LOW QUALITY PROTEIN: breast cancer metastasis-suppressor 1-like protein [Drosophila nasuta]|uniref:Breast cancer metastasis-suppressor 1-like protein n=1 Tax=Drosophila albomicans TaxID=7291 RepID=A0A6P8WC50_DROAB|nr:breast cancer metastasis-suppressor 1-like protein [Drosophila albomicans]XP_060661945.1 LOW QUALITY PROTEIN: breast cancer metastasis-suppressor 1-like protein [Drosophila nasuta]
MPVKNGESDAEGDVSGAETERSNSSQAHDTSDEEEEEEEEANECDSDDSSEMDASEIERRRAEYLEDLASLERQFGQLREQYYYERISLIDRQLSEVRAGRSEEFLQPQKELDKVYRTRIEVADVLRKFRLQNIEHKYLSEEQAAAQHFESEKQMTMDYLREDLLERIRRLEEDRHNVEISWDNWGNDKRQSKVRGPGRKKAVTVTGPYVVYMLREEDIMEDWTIIRKALKRSSTTAATGGSGGSTAVATTAAGVPSSGGGGGSGSGGLLSVQLAATAMVGGG